MHRRRRALRIVMWTGVLLSVLIAAALVGSFWHSIRYAPNTADEWAQPQAAVWVNYGYFTLLKFRGFPTGWFLHPARDFPWQERAWIWPERVVEKDASEWSITLPLWFPLALVLLPTLACAFLLRRHARRPGHCPACGYDLTGNTSGRCPECGELV